MFGIEFPELVIIAVVALIVIGPEHLPKVARTMGHLWGRAQRYISGVKADISRDMALEELRKLQKEAQQGAVDFEVSMKRASQELGSQMNKIENNISGSKYELGKSIPANEVSTEILDKSELLKSEATTETESVTDSNVPQQSASAKEMPRHEIIEEHHAVMPASAEHKKSTEV